MLGSLIMREKIQTTEAKAKEIKKMIDKIISCAKKTKIEGRRVSVMRDLRNQIPLPAIKKITGEFLDKFLERNSGYARVVRLGKRKSDSAQMAIIEFV